MTLRIPVAQPDLSGNEEKYVVDAIRSTWIASSGAYLNRFESEFAGLCDTKHAVACCNGTVALHLALLGLGVRPGDEVIIPSLTYIATANAVRYVGAEPVFVDVDPTNWCIDPERIEQAITPRTRGIIAVHLMGHPADMDRINRLAAVHGLWVVEDAAEATLAKYKGRPVGCMSNLATFSFFGNKLFTSGEGGAITVNDEQLATRLRILRGQGMDPQRRYYFPVTGYNFRLTNVAAAILCAQLERRDAIMSRRREIYALYNRLLSEIPGMVLQPVAEWAELSPWMYCVTVDEQKFGRTRDELATELTAAGIETRPMFIPLHSLPPFREASRQRGEYLPITDALSQTSIMLPTYTQLTDEQVTTICRTIAKACRAGQTSSNRRAA